MKDKVIIYSGGLDSTTLLHEYKDEIAMAITFNYGQNHREKEYKYACFNCLQLDIPLMSIDLKDVFACLKSSLLSGADAIPEGHYEDENMKSTVVPFRNGIMLSIACAIAESMGLKYVLIANHGGDHAIYPDCRGTFINAMNDAMAYGTYNNINILAPYTGITKADIVKRGAKLGINYENTWSCYKGQDVHCGKCGTCVERKEAFELAGVPDPTIYKNI